MTMIFSPRSLAALSFGDVMTSRWLALPILLALFLLIACSAPAPKFCEQRTTPIPRKKQP
jgi:hypothetical protein